MTEEIAICTAESNGQEDELRELNIKDILPEHGILLQKSGRNIILVIIEGNSVRARITITESYHTGCFGYTALFLFKICLVSRGN